MTAILLAAGVGKRMGPSALPKCLMQVGGRSLLRRTLEALRAAGIRQVVVVVGYRAAEIVAEGRAHAAGIRLTFVENPRYREGAILSLWAAREYLGGPALIMDADVLFPSGFIERLTGSAHANALLVDGTSPDTGEEQVVLGRGPRVLNITKQPSAALRHEMTAFGESVGFLKLSPPATERLRSLLDRAVSQGQVTIEHEQVYPELFREVLVGYERVDGLPWTEIDTAEDLARAEREILPRWASAPCLNRVLARRVLPWVLQWPLTPNHWTAISFAIGLWALRSMATGGWPAIVVAVLLFQLFYLVDIWDGEVARARGLSTRLGAWFDIAVDAVIQTALPLAMASGLVADGGPSWGLPVARVASLGVALDFFVTGVSKLRGFGPSVHGDPSRSPEPGTRTGIRRWLTVNLTNENFSWLVIAVLLCNLRAVFLVAMAVGTQVFWMVYLWRYRARLFGYTLDQARR